MNVRLFVLAPCAFGLVALVGLDYWPKAIPVAAVQMNEAQSPALAMLNPLSQRDMSDFQAVFDHPLFELTRSTNASVVGPVETTLITASPAFAVTDQVPTPKPVLMGTVSSPMPGGAYLGDDTGGPVFFLRPGQTAHGLTLQKVFARSAVFMGPDGQVSLPLQDTTAPEMTPTISITRPSL